jgi:putative intracellular protease/amidase
VIAGICAGNLVMASAGLMLGRRGTHNYTAEYAPPEKVAATHDFWSGMHFVRANLVQDGNLITAQPWAYRQYTAAVGRALRVLSEAQAAELESYIARRTYSDAS